jgi:integrase
LPSGVLRVRVYASRDPLTKRDHYLVEIVPPGPEAAAEAEKVPTRFLHQVDEQRSPRTRATVNQLMDICARGQRRSAQAITFWKEFF